MTSLVLHVEVTDLLLGCKTSISRTTDLVSCYGRIDVQRNAES